MLVLRQLKARHPLLYTNALYKANTRGFASPSRDYYEILGLKTEASYDEIREAYRNLAKQYHPEVTTTDAYTRPDADKFKEVSEAFSVLSVPETRMLYDLEKQKFPEAVFRAQKEALEKHLTKRDKSGNIKKEPYSPGSYAEFKQKWLAEERKKFNVDALGRYKGGLPRRGRGGARGEAMGEPHQAHDVLIHNIKNNPDPEYQHVTSEDALAFKHYQNEDRHFIKKKWTWFEAEVDYEYFQFKGYRATLRWFRNIALVLFGTVTFSELYLRLANRQALKAIKSLAQTVDLREGVKVGDRVVKQGSTGIIKYAN